MDHPEDDDDGKQGEERSCETWNTLEVDEAVIALFIGAMNANGHGAREELARAHHLIWSTRRFAASQARRWAV